MIRWHHIGKPLAASLSLFLLVAMRTSSQDVNIETATDGIFSDAQAARGEKEYQKYCSAGCHMPDLTGNERAPSLAGDSFLQRWRPMTVEDLFQRVQSTMPQTRPQSLPPEAYLDIIAFILQANGLASGPTELRNEPGHLKNLRM